MLKPQASDQCSKQILFLKHVTPNQSAWIAFGAMIPMALLAGISVLFFSPLRVGTRSRSQTLCMCYISTLLLVVVGAFAFVLNMAFMHMQYCGPATSTPAVIGALSIWMGDIVALVALTIWIWGMIKLVKAWRGDRKQRHVSKSPPRNRGRDPRKRRREYSLNNEQAHGPRIPKDIRKPFSARTRREQEDSHSNDEETQDSNQDVRAGDQDSLSHEQDPRANDQDTQVDVQNSRQDEQTRAQQPRSRSSPDTCMPPHAQSTLVSTDGTTELLEMRQKSEAARQQRRARIPQGWSTILTISQENLAWGAKDTGKEDGNASNSWALVSFPRESTMQVKPPAKAHPRPCSTVPNFSRPGMPKGCKDSKEAGEAVPIDRNKDDWDDEGMIL